MTTPYIAEVGDASEINKSDDGTDVILFMYYPHTLTWINADGIKSTFYGSRMKIISNKKRIGNQFNFDTYPLIS